MTQATAQPPVPTGPTNPRVELGRYSIATGERVIYGQRILGVVRLTDVPADGRARHYLIERDLTEMAELEAIVADYLDQAALWQAVPADLPAVLDARGDSSS